MNDFDASRCVRSVNGAALVLGAAFLAITSVAHAEPPIIQPAATAATPSPPAPAPSTAATTAPTPAAGTPATAPPPAATPKPDADDDEAPAGSSVVPPTQKNEASFVAVPVRSAAKPSVPPDEPVHPDDGLMGTHQEHWIVGIGLRESFIAHSGFDPFSTNNVLPQFSVDAGRALYASGPFSLAVLALFDYGSVKANARGADTSLNVARVTAAAEARYHFWRRFYLFGRVAPGALHSGAALKDPVAGVDQEADAWAFASDFSLGAAVEFAGEARGDSSRPRGWLGLDGGYGYAQATKLALKTSDTSANVPARLEPVALGELAVRGGFFRVNGTITF